MFERLRGALRAALDAATPAGGGVLSDLARQMGEAVVEAKVVVQELREILRRREGDLALERQRLSDAERRGRLAAEIQDGETVVVAERFASKHRERVTILERKLVVEGDELAQAERELGEMREQMVRAQRDRPVTEAERSAERAWRDLERAGGGRPGTDPGAEARGEIDRAARERAAEQQLRELKKRMKKD